MPKHYTFWQQNAMLSAKNNHPDTDLCASHTHEKNKKMSP